MFFHIFYDISCIDPLPELFQVLYSKQVHGAGLGTCKPDFGTESKYYMVIMDDFVAQTYFYHHAEITWLILFMVFYSNQVQLQSRNRCCSSTLIFVLVWN